MKAIRSRNCAIREKTADGQVVGRCWFYVGNYDICPRHGDVQQVMKRYRQTGKLTDEGDSRCA